MLPLFAQFLPAGQEPKAIARYRAVLSGEEPIGGAIAEWTAPSTPIVLIYGTGKVLEKGDGAIVVGNIGD
jgi:hypothetical protein